MSHDDQDRPNLKRLAQQAPDFLAEPLFAYQVAHQLTNEQLAAEVGIPVEQLQNLALCSAPTAEGDIATLAHHVQGDASLLSDWFKRLALDPISRMEQADGRVLYRLWNDRAKQAILLEPYQLLDLLIYTSDNEELIRHDARANDCLAPGEGK